MIDWEAVENRALVKLLQFTPTNYAYPENWYQAQALYAEFRGWA